MGDTEKMSAPPSGEELPEGVHPENMQQENVWLIQKIIYSATTLAADYGWYVLISALIGFYLWTKLQPRLNKWNEQREDAEYHKNPDKYASQLKGAEAARERLQQKYNEEAKIRAQQMKEIEEKRREERLAKKEKLHGAEVEESCTEPKKRIPFRPEYNPLMSSTNSGFRSSRSSRGG